MTVFIVMVGDYDGDLIDSVYLSHERANIRRDELEASDKETVPCTYYVSESDVIESPAS